jgi:hypothetical protein
MPKRARETKETFWNKICNVIIIRKIKQVFIIFINMEQISSVGIFVIRTGINVMTWNITWYAVFLWDYDRTRW